MGPGLRFDALHVHRFVEARPPARCQAPGAADAKRWICGAEGGVAYEAGIGSKGWMNRDISICILVAASGV